MPRRTFLRISLSLLLSAACTPKASTGPSGFVIDVTPDKALEKTVAVLGQQGFAIETLDRERNTIRTGWKDLTKDELFVFARLSDSQSRYQLGRYAFDIAVSEDGSASRLEITARIEGNLTPRQTGSDDFGITTKWQVEISNGRAEQTLFAQLSK